jgi:D-alanyl-D-alanine carboxypeptidase
VGNYILYDSLGELRRIPLLTAGEMERGGFFKRLIDSIRFYFRRRAIQKNQRRLQNQN